MLPKTKRIEFELNGNIYNGDIKLNQTLLDFLREFGLKSVKCGCRVGDCGMCTILLDGKPTRSCLILMKELQGKIIETVENLNINGQLHPLQKAFWETGAVQCGIKSRSNWFY